MPGFAALRATPEFAALIAASAALGRDPLQVQAAGGNTSLKAQGAMWVKASGFWLAEAEKRDVFLPVDVAGLRAALQTGRPFDAMAYVPTEANPNGLRPSIETTLHAALDWPVVLHTHCVATIALAVRADVEALLAERLDGLDAVFVPYAMPGPSLARAILERAIPPQTRLAPAIPTGARARVVVLGNHGLVVGGPDVVTAVALLREVSRRLAGAPAEAERWPDHPPAGLAEAMPGTLTETVAGTRAETVAEALAGALAGSGWRPVDHAPTHAMARDPRRLALVARGSLYPDHVIFLGPGVAVAAPGERPDATMARTGGQARLLLLPGLGAALPADASPAQIAMARCLGDVAMRIAPDAALTVLSPEDEAALLDWDAEKYRQALEAARQEGGA
ncbi:MAG: class II aldolase/adducin family protein [Pseudomonadota bacterium]